MQDTPWYCRCGMLQWHWSRWCGSESVSIENLSGLFRHGAQVLATLGEGVRVGIVAIAALISLGTYLALGVGYPASGSAMVATIVAMILLDAAHPPAVATTLSFALSVVC